VKENISFGLEIRKVPEEKRDEEVQNIAKRLGILRLLEKKPSTLSGGEAQRVAIARTIITNPSVYLLDEPLGNLDAKFRRQLTTEIKELHMALRKTFIYVTHDQEQAISVPDKVAVMKDGKLLQVGPPLELYRKPIDLFVAEFFGTPHINLVRGELPQDEPLRFTSKTVNLSLEDYPYSDRLEDYGGNEVVVGVRPEDVTIQDPKIEGGDGCGTVTSTINVGDKYLVYIGFGQDKPLVAFTPPSSRPSVGSSVAIRLDKNRLIFFDPVSEKRIAPA